MAKKRKRKLAKENTRLTHNLRDERPMEERPRARRKQRGAEEQRPIKYHLIERGMLKPRTSGSIAQGANIFNRSQEGPPGYHSRRFFMRRPFFPGP